MQQFAEHSISPVARPPVFPEAERRETTALLHQSLGDRFRPLRPGDERLFRCSNTGSTPGYAIYSNAYCYLKQACRDLDGGYLYHDERMVAALGYHNRSVVVVAPRGDTDAALEALVARISRTTQEPVFIKKLLPENVPDFASKHLISRINGNHFAPAVWCTSAPADDDTFPEQITSIAQTLDILTAPSQWVKDLAARRITPLAEGEMKKLLTLNHQFRRQLHKALNAELKITLRPYQPADRDDVRNLIVAHFQSSSPGAVLAYHHMLDPELESTNRAIQRFTVIAKELDRPVGFFCVERLDAESVGMYGDVLSRALPGLPELAEVRLLELLRSQGLSFINKGGSENQDLNRYKRKRGPIEEREMPVFVYSP